MNRNLMLVSVLLAATVFTLPAAGQSVPKEETPAERDARMQWWREARFGMFIHWGVYSVPAGTYQNRKIGGIGEWIMRNAQIPVDQYRAYAQEFNPIKFDPNQWATLAEQAGMRYIVITSKHHDGFALFPSEVTDWDIADASPYGKDLIGPLAAAARQHGLKFGLYYSQAQDWTHPGGAKAGLKDGEGWCDEHKGSFDKYLRGIAVPQTREILTNYHPDILWWDTPHLMTRERADLLRPLLELCPGIITNNRLGGGYTGDTDTPEQHIPATGIRGRDWETCMTMNDTWGYKSYDDHWKSTDTLIRNLVDIASKGGNYLLNIGPKPDGTIPQPSIQRLQEVGQWMQRNGDSIYGTTASPTRRPAWGRITKKVAEQDTTLYLHVFDWPDDGRLPVAITNRPISCRLLSDASRTFEVESTENGLVVQLTGSAPDKICSVVELQVEGRSQPIIQRISQREDGSLVLPAVESDLRGSLQVEAKYGDPNIGYWTNSGDWVQWNLRIASPGRFRVSADVASMGKSRMVVQTASARLTADIPSTGGYGTFLAVDLGELVIEDAGVCELSLRPVASAWSPVNVRTVKLTPVR